MIKFKEVTINKNSFLLEIADNEFLRSFGLKHRNFIDNDSGMLFIYPKETNVRFHMKNVLKPLEVLFIDKEGIIFDIQLMDVCDNYDGIDYFYPSKPVKYVIEVNKGFCERFNIKKFDKIEL